MKGMGVRRERGGWPGTGFREAIVGHGKQDQAGHRGRRPRLGEKILRILLDVALDGFEVSGNLGEVAIARAQFVHHEGDRRAARFPVELAHRLAMLALPDRRLAGNLANLSDGVQGFPQAASANR